MRAIHRKLIRDLWYLRGQALAIALVIASGIATYVMSASTLDSLERTRERFYTENRFAEVFAGLKRAPMAVAARIAEIPGVEAVETRVVAPVKLQVAGYGDPVRGRLIALPDAGSPRLNRLTLRAGRLPQPFSSDEVVVAEAFAQAHDFREGDRIGVIINGGLEQLTIVGVVLSPEYVYQIQPGSVFPDFARYGILWMGRHALGIAYDMDGAFNDVSLALSRDAGLDGVIERLDLLLEPYGGRGAFGRIDQLSNRYLDAEFKQLRSMSTLFPAIFLSVAAFLLNVVVSRLIDTQRDQIAILKAFGYPDRQIGLHYLGMVGLIVTFGASAGVVIGMWLGRGLSDLYTEFFRFPGLDFVVEPSVLVIAVLVTATASLAGTWRALGRATRLPPAEAMRPEPPADYRVSLLERLGLQRWLSQPTRMILRHLGRTPLKSGMAVLGIAMACGILMVGKFQEDSIDYMVAVQFGLAQREDMWVNLVEPTSFNAVHELISLPGVHHAEGFRQVPVRLLHGHRSYRTGIQSFASDNAMRRVLNLNLEPQSLPETGIVLTDYLAAYLGVEVGGTVVAEVLEGARPRLELPVAAVVKEFIGVGAYARRTFINRVMAEGNAVTGAYLAVDRDQTDAVYQALDERPRVAGVAVRRLAIRNFYDTFAETLLTFTLISTVLAATIAFGVVYNSARIALSERARELASLRVLGYTRAEIGYILIGELALLTTLAIPLGFIGGRTLCGFIADNLESDLYRVPLVLEGGTYAFSATVVIVSALISGWVVKDRLNRLDLVEVLKTRE